MTTFPANWYPRLDIENRARASRTVGLVAQILDFGLSCYSRGSFTGLAAVTSRLFALQWAMIGPSRRETPIWTHILDIETLGDQIAE